MAKKHTNEEWLRRQYHEKGKKQSEIAEMTAVNTSTICYWMDKLDIEARSKSVATSMAREGLSHTLTHSTGYEAIGYTQDYEDYTYLIHRLCAVAWFDFDLFGDKIVHHKNGQKLDNREENLEVLTRQKHQSEKHPDTASN